MVGMTASKKHTGTTVDSGRGEQEGLLVRVSQKAPEMIKKIKQ